MRKEDKVKTHEEFVKRFWAKAKGAKRRELLDFHNRQISFLQHERSIHLTVTLFFGGASLFLAWAVLISVSWLLPAVFLVMLITTFFYIIHYYRLENTCQRWQSLSAEMEKELVLKK